MFNGRKILGVVSAVLLLAALSSATTKKKAHAAPRHKAHDASHPAAQKNPVDRHSSRKTTKTKAHKHGRKTARKHGQQQIDSARAREIQDALVRANYMQGEPTGKWDQSTKDAMARFQADNGWQTKNIPDARALIKLGLGPSHDHLLNPETAITTRPESVGGGQKESELPSTHGLKPTADGASDHARIRSVSSPETSSPAATPVTQPADGSSGSQQETVAPSTPR